MSHNKKSEFSAIQSGEYIQTVLSDKTQRFILSLAIPWMVPVNNRDLKPCSGSKFNDSESFLSGSGPLLDPSDPRHHLGEKYSLPSFLGGLSAGLLVRGEGPLGCLTGDRINRLFSVLTARYWGSPEFILVTNASVMMIMLTCNSLHLVQLFLFRGITSRRQM